MNRDNQSKFSNWLTLKCILIQSMESPADYCQDIELEERLIRSEEIAADINYTVDSQRRHFYADRSPPENWYIYVAKTYNSQSSLGAFNYLPGLCYNNSIGRFEPIFTMTMSIGGIGVIISNMSDMRIKLDQMKFTDNNFLITRIYPATLRPALVGPSMITHKKIEDVIVAQITKYHSREVRRNF